MSKRLLAVLGSMALVFSAGASAQGYLAISVGASKLKADCAGTTTCDNTGAGAKLLGGYKFDQGLAAEFGYFNFGKASATVANVSAEIENDGIGGGVALHRDLAQNVPFVARLGLARIKTRISGAVASLGSASTDDSNIAFYAGLGIGYRFTEGVSVEAAWDYSKSKYDKNGFNISGGINVFSVGLTFWF
jgi:Outer membrane protein beta-barrel domain